MKFKFNIELLPNCCACPKCPGGIAEDLVSKWEFPRAKKVRGRKLNPKGRRGRRPRNHDSFAERQAILNELENRPVHSNPLAFCKRCWEVVNACMASFLVSDTFHSRTHNFIEHSGSNVLSRGHLRSLG